MNILVIGVGSLTNGGGAMTRISNYIKEPFVERRVKERSFWEIPNTNKDSYPLTQTKQSDDRRATEHNYLNPKPLFKLSVPVEPQPWLNDDEDSIHYKRWMVDFEGFDISCVDEQSLKEQLLELASLKQNDQVVLPEEWAKFMYGYHTKLVSRMTGDKEMNKSYYNFQPPETMPAHLNTHKVLSVLGCEELATPDIASNRQEFVMVDDVWNFIYLTEEV